MKRAQLYVSSIGEDCCESARDFGVGIELAQFCTAARLDGVVIEAGGAMLVRRAETLAAAEAAGLFLVGLDPAGVAA